MKNGIFFLIFLFASINAANALTLTNTTISRSGTWDLNGSDFIMVNSTVNLFPYNGSTGSGTLYIYANNISLDGSSIINGNEAGFYTGSVSPGDGGSGTNSSAQGGNGGGYGGVGGIVVNTATIGVSYGTVNGTDINMGSSGGFGWRDGCYPFYEPGEVGGSGGGLIYLSASNNITVNGKLYSNGGNGRNSPCTNGGGSGGGSGGGIFITGRYINASYSTIQSKGGNGGHSTYYGTAGGGAGGRVKWAANSVSNISASITTTGGSINAQSGTENYNYVVTNLVPSVTKKTIAWTWTNPTVNYLCTEIYLNGVYQSCDAVSNMSFIDLIPATEYTISLRVKDTSNLLFSFINNTMTTLSFSGSPTILSSYSLSWFSPNKGQNFPITVNYTSSLVPLRNISIVIRTHDENTYVRSINASYNYSFLVSASKIINWNGKADNYQIVPDAYYISQVTVTDYDGNTATLNNSFFGVDSTYPSSIMEVSKSRLFQSFYYKSNYSSPDPLRINLGYYYGDFNTTILITENPVTGDNTLSNLVIRKIGYISTTAGIQTFAISKDDDGKAWMWVDGIQVYNSNAGLLSTSLPLSSGYHEIVIEYAKGTANTWILLLPTIDGSEMEFVNPVEAEKLTLFSNDFGGSGNKTVFYSFDNGASYQIYTSPIEVPVSGIITVCSDDTVENEDVCKRYTPSFNLVSVTSPAISNTGIPYPYDATDASFPELPNITEASDLLTNHSTPQNGSFSSVTDPAENSPVSWYGGWHCCSYGSYTYDYFDRPIYYSNHGSLVQYSLSVVQFNTDYDAQVRTSMSDNVSFDLFNVSSHPIPSVNRTTRIGTLNTQPFGVFRSDITSLPSYQFLTASQAIYAPASTVSPVSPPYNLGDTLQFNVNISSWDDTDSSTIEIPGVQAILYSPINPYTNESSQILQVYDIGTVTGEGGNYTFNFTTSGYTDLVGNYGLVLWMPTIGGNIYQSSIQIGYGSIDPALYNEMRLIQYVNGVTISCPVGWSYLTSNYTGGVTLLELDNKFLTDSVQGFYNSSSQKYTDHRTGYRSNENQSIAWGQGYYYYFTAMTDVKITPGRLPPITIRPGWNLVGNYWVNNRTLGELKASIGSDAIYAKYYNGRSWVSTDSQIVPPMKSFFVYSSNSIEWG